MHYFNYPCFLIINIYALYNHALTLCMRIFCRLLIIFKINFFEKQNIQEYTLSAKQFDPDLGPNLTVCIKLKADDKMYH